MASKHQVVDGDLVVLTPAGEELIAGSELANEDLRPVPKALRTWSTYHMAVLWAGMVICVPTYLLAAGLISLGMSAWQALFTILLGQLIVLIPLTLSAHIGVRYGIPYPVVARLWFGLKGAHVPTLMRAVVAAGWFGIQTWVAGKALDEMLAAVMPAWKQVPGHLAVSFLAFWAANVLIAYRGPEAIKRLEAVSVPVMAVATLLLAAWAVSAAGGFGPIFSQPAKLKGPEFWKVFLPSLTGMIAFWAPMAINISDFSRYARDQRSQIAGQFIGLPVSMFCFTLLAVIITSATSVVFGEPIWDPSVLLSRFHPLVTFVGGVVILLSTLTTNIPANMVAPIRAAVNLLPRKISFGTGAVIIAVLGLLMMPWYIMASFGNYIFGWLNTYAAFLGPLDGMLIADYWLVRKGRISLVDLYKTAGSIYEYRRGVNTRAVGVLLLSILVPVMGRLVPSLRFLFDNAWLVGFVVALFLYWAVMKDHESVLSEERFRQLTEPAQAA